MSSINKRKSIDSYTCCNCISSTIRRSVGREQRAHHFWNSMGRKGVLVRDGLSDLFTRLRNGQMAKRASILAPYSRLALNVLDVLTERGYLRGVRVVGPTCVRSAQHDQLEIFLKYDALGKGAINEIKRISKPSRRIYKRIEQLPVSNAGLGTFILSTSRGVIHCADARRHRVGGELLGEIL